MNMLAARAEMAMWSEGIAYPLANNLADRSVVNSVIEEFPERMGDLANYMAKIYSEPIIGYKETL